MTLLGSWKFSTPTKNEDGHNVWDLHNKSDPKYYFPLLQGARAKWLECLATVLKIPDLNKKKRLCQPSIIGYELMKDKGSWSSMMPSFICYAQNTMASNSIVPVATRLWKPLHFVPNLGSINSESLTDLIKDPFWRRRLYVNVCDYFVNIYIYQWNSQN